MPFQKGQISNPEGAKKSRAWQDAIRRAIARHGDNYRSGLNKLADELVKAAAAGDQWALKEIGDRLDGKPAIAIDTNAENVTFALVQITAPEEPAAIEGELSEPPPVRLVKPDA